MSELWKCPKSIHEGRMETHPAKCVQIYATLLFQKDKILLSLLYQSQSTVTNQNWLHSIAYVTTLYCTSKIYLI